MPAINGTDLNLLRQQHRARFYLTVAPASVLWSAQVAGAHSREDTTVAFDGGSGANFAAITAGMELWIGTTAGDYDVDRLRIKSVSSGDAGVTGTFTVADNSVVWADNQHLTVIGWFLLKPRRPDIGDDGTFYKDGGASTGGIAYTDDNTKPSPITIGGENRAGFLDPDTGTWVITSQLPSSYAIASGATISSYAASLVYGPDTPVISINSGTGVGTVTFDTAGLYWIKWTCTDSNGKSQDTYRYYYAHSTDPQSAHYPLTRFSINNIQGQWNNGGWSCGIQVHGDADLDAIPDYAPCIVWSENWYGATKKNITFLPDESGTVLGGYIRRDKFAQDIEKDAHVADFSITTIQGTGDNKYNFSVSLEASQTVDTWWKYPSWLTPTRAVHHFFKWHSTLLEVADVIGLDSNTDGDSHVEFPDGSLFERANGALAVIRSRLVCNAGSRVVFVEDVQLRLDSERGGLTVVQDITSADKNGPVDFVREQEKRVPFMYLAAFDYDGGFKADGNPEVFSRCAIAPGNNAYEDGAQPATEGRQIVVDQTHANQIVGRFLHAANNEYPEITIPVVGRLGVLAIHLSEFWTLTTLTGDTARQIAKTFNLILRQVTAAINVEQGTVACTATFEAEASGPVGIFAECPGFPDLPDTDFEIPDADSELGGALMTASSINYLPPQSKSWVERSAESVLDAYADPHWPIKQDSFASADAIIWRCGTGYIKRSVDAGINWSTVTPGDPPNDASDSPAPTVASVSFVRGEGNFIVDQEHVFVARWQNASNDWRSWIAYTADDGANWTWQSVGQTQTGSFLVDTLSNAGGQPMSRSLIEMSSTRVVVYHGTVFSLIDSQNLTVLDEGGLSNTQFQSSICRLTDTTFANANIDFDAGNVWAYVFSTDSDTIVRVGSVVLEAGPTDGVTAIERIDDTHFVVAYTDSSGHGKVVACEFNPGEPNEFEAIAFGTADTFNAGSTPYLAMCPASFVLSATFNVVYAEDTTAIKCKTVAAGGMTITAVGTAAVLASVQAKFISCAQLSGDKFIAAYADASDSDNGYAVVATVDTGTNTVGSPVEFKAAVLTATSMAAQSSSVAYVAYQHTTTGLAYTDISISGHVATVGSETAFPEAGHYPIIMYGTAGLVYGYRDTSNNMDIVFAGGAGGELKALGLSIGKGVGEIVYVTGWDGVQLVLLILSLPGLVLVDNISLGAATESEVNANTWIARPYSPFGSDAACYVYGRMDDPLGSGTAHILLTEDEALSFTEVEQGWSTDFCGAVLEDYSRIMAIRNLASSSKLYTGAVGSALKVASTLPFTAQVNPQAMIFDFINGALYCGSASADSIMVVVSPEPNFTRWFDTTWDHDNTVGIKAVITL